MKSELKKIIEKAIKENPCDFSIEVPGEKSHGDYSTNVALVLAKKIGKSPKETAEMIKAKILEGKTFKKIEIAGPGFINFFISDKYFIDNLKKVDKNYGKAEGSERSRRIVIDYTDPNPFKEFHIGHLMSNAIGESLSRIFEFQGAKIKRVCFQGDVGIHVAKAIWGKLHNPDLDWGPAYAFGSDVFEIEESKQEIIELNKKIYNRSDEEINKLYDEGKKESLEHFDKIYKELDTKFDDLIFESQVIDLGKQIVEKGLKEGIFVKGLSEKGDGKEPIIFPGELYGLHTRVFINSEGLPTYEAKDLGLAELKYKKYKYDESVVVTANEQNSHFAVMLCALDKINKKLAEKTKHISHGMLKLPEGKMSSRSGVIERDGSGKIINVISKAIPAESLIKKVKELVKEKIKDRELSEIEKKEIVETVAIGAIRYSILKQSIGSDIIYDFNKSISFEGDSGPYLQYSYTRAKSILRKAKEEKIKPSFKKVPAEITQLEKSISYFSEVVLKAGESCEPHFITLYLTELAGVFNNYYANNKIVDVTDEYSSYKVALTEAFAIVMKNGLLMLGIKAPEKM
jgi:arginyl-tRNA synthetase